MGLQSQVPRNATSVTPDWTASSIASDGADTAARCHPTDAALTAVTWRRDKMTSSHAPLSSRATVNASG
jgi:hypothetical protein